MPVNLCKSSVAYLIVECVLQFILQTDAAFHALKSDDNVLQKFKIISENETENEYRTAHTHKWNRIQITETSLNSNEYVDPTVNIRQQNESFAPDELPWDVESGRKKVDSNEMQMIYWYYDKVMDIILGISFGIAVNLENVKAIFKEPIGPSIGIFCKFILSPFLSYKLGLIFFTDHISQRYELIINGITLMGFVAVCWTVLLDGNVDLSVTMSIINTQLFMVFWPLWIAFGQWMLYDNDSDDEFQVSIDHGYLIAPAFIIVSLSFGIIIQYVFPQCKIGILPLLKPISSYYLLFYFVLLLFCLSGSGATTIHLFYAGFFLSAVGYCAGWFIALAMKLPYGDRIAIGCESTVQNSAQFCTSIPMVCQLFVVNMNAYTPIDE